MGHKLQITNIDNIINSVVNDIIKSIQLILITNLKLDNNSDLIQSIGTKKTKNALQIFANDYYKFLLTGKKRFTKKVPIIAILKFINEKNINPDKGVSKNKLAYMIQSSIYKKGIMNKGSVEVKIENITQEIIIKSIQEQFDINVI